MELLYLDYMARTTTTALIRWRLKQNDHETTQKRTVKDEKGDPVVL